MNRLHILYALCFGLLVCASAGSALRRKFQRNTNSMFYRLNT